MITEIILPKLGETMEEGTIAAWHKKEGEAIEKGEVLLEITTDKAVFESEAPQSGVLRKILCAASESAVPVATVIGYIADTMDELLPALATASSTADTTTPSSPPVSPSSPAASSPVSATTAAERVKASPLIKRLAREKGIDLSHIKGTGPEGKITQADLEGSTGESPAQPQAKLGSLKDITRVAAERLTKSKQEAPHYYIQMEINMTAAANLKTKITDTENIHLTYTDIIIKAVADALQEFPLVNAILKDNEIKKSEDINIGIAAAIEEGLIVPVIKKAGKKELAEIAKARQALIVKLKEKTLTLDDISGGTFTISNLGMFGVDVFTAIINPPQLAILSVGQIKECPVVIDGKIAARPIMKVCLSSDHRFLNGDYSANFLKRVKTLIETSRNV